MSEFSQPWRRATIGGLAVRLQIIDPQTAFDIEPEIIKRTGGELLMALAAPVGVMDAVALMASRSATPQLEAARMALKSLTALMAGLPKDGAWLASVFERAVLGRLRHPVHGLIETWDDFPLLALNPARRWHLLAVQIANTFGPLWRRSPYSAGGRKPPDYGVPLPNAPIAFQWAAAIASQGYASSAHEILSAWTPEQLINSVEIAAHVAEHAHRSSEAARQGSV